MIRLSILLLLTPLAAFAGEAPADAVEHDGHRYKLYDEVEDLSWTLGKERCEKLGGHLVTIADQAEADFVASLCDGKYMFLGATDATEEGQWAWVDGSPWSFTHWMKGQPNDYTGAEDYLATYDGGAWVDVDHGGDDFWMPTGFICEWSGAE